MSRATVARAALEERNRQRRRTTRVFLAAVAVLLVVVVWLSVRAIRAEGDLGGPDPSDLTAGIRGTDP